MAHRLLRHWSSLSEGTFGSLFEHAPIMMHSIGHDGRLINVSAFWADTLGYERDEMIGRLSIDFLTPESRNRAVNEVLPVFRETGSIRNASYDFVCKDGTVIPVLMSALAQFADDGKLDSSLAVMFDNTEAMHTRDELERKAEEAQQANMAKSAFIANISHEIRTPLNGVIGMASALNATPLGPDQTRMLQTIANAGNHLLALVDDILDLSRVEAGVRCDFEQPFVPADIAIDVVGMMKPNLADRAVKLRVDVDEGARQRVVGDPGRFRQVLNNLLSNAVKFTQDGTIDVTINAPRELGTEHTALEIRVADTGIGVPDTQKDRIFGRFEIGSHTEDLQLGGAGLGLTLARSVCEQHSGTLTVEDTPGGGATFVATLRARIPETQRPANDEKGYAEMDPMTRLRNLPRPLNLLVAEDNRMNQRVLSTLVGFAPVTVTFVENGADALTLLEQESFDGALIDIRMPVMNGLEFIEAFRAREAEAEAEPLPCIAFSANVMRHQRDLYAENGFDDCLPKPIELNALADCLYWISDRDRRTEQAA